MVPTYRATDDRGRKTEAVIWRGSLLHFAILPSDSFNLTMPKIGIAVARALRASEYHSSGEDHDNP